MCKIYKANKEPNPKRTINFWIPYNATWNMLNVNNLFIEGKIIVELMIR